MHSRFDLDRFIDRINGLFQWFGSDSLLNYQRYVAPYFPMIQSSGTGKTRLLINFKEEINQSNDTYCDLFNCESSIYDSKIHKQFDIEEMQKEGGVPDINRTWKYLNSLLPKDPTKTKVVFLFDEAQELLEKDAIYFRYIRWWLREKANERGDERIPKVVAVFTGTTTRLSHYYPEKSIATGDSRNPHKKFWNPDGEYECYDPFFDLTTMGSVWFTDGQNYTAGSEYERAALCGRPLFAHLQIEKNRMVALNDKRRYLILQRMLFQRSNTTYRQSESVLMNILGTRVQMGFVSFSLASKLVSSGYAHLVSLRPKTSWYAIKNHKKIIDEDIAHICYQPDPVCAHLAICLMDSHWKYDEISGCDPTFWTEAATELFSSGVCHPSKGDVGEIATALYLLFCGDKLRQRIDSKYMHFSIDFSTFTEQLLSNCDEGLKFTAPPELSKSTNKCTVNFIQITKLHFRVPLKDLCSQETLEWMYNTAYAIYIPTFSEIFDILAPIKCVDEDGKTIFIPFTVNVKSQSIFSRSDVDMEFIRMKNQTEESKIEHGLCLLVLLDAKDNPLNSNEQDISDIASNLTKEVVYKAIAIRNDLFGINKLVQDTRGLTDNTLSEVYSSHASLPYLPDRFWNEKPSSYTDKDWEYAKRVSNPDSVIDVS